MPSRFAECAAKQARTIEACETGGTRESHDCELEELGDLLSRNATEVDALDLHRGQFMAFSYGPPFSGQMVGARRPGT